MLKQPAFTLIEILVVATIIILLTSISIASFSIANKSARDAKKKGDIETVRQALVLYRTQNGSYPTKLDFTGITGALGTFLSPPAPADAAYSGKSNPADFCICALVTAGKGNSGAACAWAPGGTYYCATQPY